MDTEKKRTRGIRRAFQILDCLVELDEPATAYTIAKRIKAPLSTVYQAITTLEEVGALSQVRESGKYFLGNRLFLFGLAFVRNSDKGRVYLRAAKEIAGATGYDSFLCVRDGDHVLVVAKTPGKEGLRVSIRDGTRVPLNWVGPGLLLLGPLDSSEREAIWRSAMETPSSRPNVALPTLENITQEYWRQKHCVYRLDLNFPVTCVGVPVVTWQGKCMAALCALIPSETATGKSAALVDSLSGVAKSIEKDLGWVDATVGQASLR